MTDPADDATEFLRRHCRCLGCDGTGDALGRESRPCLECDGAGIDPAAREAFDRVLKAKTGLLVEALRPFAEWGREQETYGLCAVDWVGMQIADWCSKAREAYDSVTKVTDE